MRDRSRDETRWHEEEFFMPSGGEGPGAIKQGPGKWKLLPPAPNMPPSISHYITPPPFSPLKDELRAFRHPQQESSDVFPLRQPPPRLRHR